MKGAPVHQEIQMSERLSKSKPHLVPVEGAPEEDRNHVHRALRDLTSGNHLIAARPVMRGKALEPSVQPEEREVVRGQGERLGRYCIAQFGQ